MTPRRALGALVLLLALLPAPGGQAETLRLQPKAVVELFTSQGCSSCPPADARLTELSGRKDVIALAYHVDYWDYIGWRDSFAAPSYSEHQRDYAESWGTTRIFTPQLVVNGAEGVVGSRAEEVDAALAKASLTVPVQLQVDGDTLRIDAAAQPSGSRATIWLVRYIDRAAVQIETGENRGRRMEYTQVVTGRQVLGTWEPDSGAHLRLPLANVLLAPSTGFAVIVQQEHAGLPGRIVGAAAYGR